MVRSKRRESKPPKQQFTIQFNEGMLGDLDPTLAEKLIIQNLPDGEEVKTGRLGKKSLAIPVETLGKKFFLRGRGKTRQVTDIQNL